MWIAYSERNLKELLDNIVEESMKNGLSIMLKKSKFMAVSKSGSRTYRFDIKKVISSRDRK